MLLVTRSGLWSQLVTFIFFLQVHRLKPSSEWRAAFNNYLRTMPAYYATPLRRALTRMGAGNLASSLVPETLDNCLSYTVLNYLKRLKNQGGSQIEIEAHAEELS